MKRFWEEGTNLRCELVTGIEGMRFVAVFNWDDMGSFCSAGKNLGPW